MYIQFHGAAGQVTGSCYLIDTGDTRILLDCGMIQGSRLDELKNAEGFAFDPASIDAVILSHSHIDHSGRLPFLVKSGFTGTIYTHRASRDLCKVMLKDAAHINEKEAEWENKKRQRKDREPVEPLFTLADVENTLSNFHGLNYNERKRISSSVSFRLNDAGHILGSSIVELWLRHNDREVKIVFSGDLGSADRPILHDPAIIRQADLVLMESTYGDRMHRSAEETHRELTDILCQAQADKGNIIIPSFAVERTQRLIYEFAKHYDEWDLDRWQIFLDSPMAISATEVYTRHTYLYDDEARELWNKNRETPLLKNFKMSRTANQSMQLNMIQSGAIIIAGSGMCTGGRIKHHLKHNIWRRHSHIVMTGFQARGTLGRTLVDGAHHIRLWGETYVVNAKVHTVGGLSAHADQADLMEWYGQFENRPPVVLVHGESRAAEALQQKLQHVFSADVLVAEMNKKIVLTDLTPLRQL